MPTFAALLKILLVLTIQLAPFQYGVFPAAFPFDNNPVGPVGPVAP